MTATIGFVTQMATPLRNSIAAADEYDFAYVEILMDGDNHRTKLAERSDAITEQLSSLGLDVMVHLPFPIDLGGPHPHVRDGSLAELKSCIRTAIELGAQKGVVHPDTTAWGSAWNTEQLRPGICRALASLHEFASDRGFELCVENLPGSAYPVGEFPALLADLSVSMTFDTGHARLSGLSDADSAAFLSTYSDRVTHIHLNDTHGQSDDHLPLGAGSIDFEQVLAGLPSDWDGTASVEVGTGELSYIGESKRHVESFVPGR